jgi:catechol 2,3-dioxygenase-like lactoylglutathione lyase family enzyme
MSRRSEVRTRLTGTRVQRSPLPRQRPELMRSGVRTQPESHGTASRHKEQQVKVKRIVANIATSDLEKASTFYGDVLGLKVLMDLGWIRTYGLDSRMTIQVGVASEGGSGTPVPDVSIEVDNLEEALARVERARIPIQYGPTSEPWGVRRFYVRDPFGKLINILQHERGLQGRKR